MQIQSNIEEFKWTNDIMNSVLSVFERPKYRFKIKLIKAEENFRKSRIKKGSMVSNYDFVVSVVDMPEISEFNLKFRFTEEGTNVTIEFRNWHKWWLDAEIDEFSRSTLFRKGHSRKIRQFAVFSANAIKRKIDARRTAEVVDD
jgi:hypothetical protein